MTLPLSNREDVEAYVNGLVDTKAYKSNIYSSPKPHMTRIFQSLCRRLGVETAMVEKKGRLYCYPFSLSLDRNNKKPLPYMAAWFDSQGWLHEKYLSVCAPIEGLLEEEEIPYRVYPPAIRIARRYALIRLWNTLPLQHLVIPGESLISAYKFPLLEVAERVNRGVRHPYKIIPINQRGQVRKMLLSMKLID